MISSLFGRDQSTLSAHLAARGVYLPDSLYDAVKERGLPASELLQEAVQAEVRRQELNEAADRYLSEIIAEVGEPSLREQTRADAIARRIRHRAAVSKAG